MTIPLAVFLKAPTRGAVKTRLAAFFDSDQRAALYRAFVTDVLAICDEVEEVEPELWVAGDLSDPFVHEIAGSRRVSVQEGADLGARMASALEGMIARRGCGLIVGTDAPTLPPSLLRRAARAVAASDVVLGPSADGGFYLVGARGPVPPLFEDVRYSTPHALADTLLHARRAGLKTSLLPPWYDVDTYRDLALLHAHLTVDPGAAPATSSKLFQLLGRPG